MKKSIYYFLLATIAVASFASCAKEEAEDVTPVATNSNIIRFKADPIDVGTKATLTPNAEDTEFAAAWEDGEEMVLNALSVDADFDHEATATWDGSEKEFSADFGAVELPTGSYEWLYEAWYPAKADIPFGSNRVQNGNNYNSSYDIMYGSLEVPNGKIGKDGSEKPIVVGMNRLTGIAYFHITGGPDEDVLGATLTTNEDLAAETVTIAAGGASLTPTTGKKTIALSFSSAPNAQDFKLWFNVLPGDYTGLTLTIYTATKKATISAASISFEAGKLRKVKKNISTWTSQLYYTKVTAVGGLTDDNYLIVYEPDNVAFDGGLATLDAGNNVVLVPRVGSYVVNTASAESAVFAIKSLGNSKFSIKSASGKYIGRDSASNGLESGANSYDNTITFTDGNAIISGAGGYQLRFNSASGNSNYRFRYYASDKQKNVALYKFNDTRTTQTLSFPNASYDAVYPGTFDAPTLSGANTTVTYSSSKTTVATVNPSTGAITIAGIGSTVITASAAADASYKAASTSYTLVVASAPITSIALLKSNLTGESQDFSITLTDAIVSGKYTDNHAFLQDGTAGIYLYNCASSLSVGDKFSGTIAVSAKLYSGIPEITAFDASVATKTTGAVLPLTTLTVAEAVSGISDYCAMRVKLEGVQFAAAITGEQNADASRGGSTIKVYSRDADMNIAKDDIADVIGFPMSYATPQIHVQSASDVSKKVMTWNLTSISVTTPPTKTSYIAGETFSTDGMVVSARYDDSTEEYTKYVDVTASCTYEPSTSTALTTDNSSISITYGGKSTSQAISVTSGGASWTKVTSLSELTSGGTFIIGYQNPSGTAGVIVPMRQEDAAVSNNYIKSGISSTTASNGNTITMATTMSSSATEAYETVIEAGATSGKIVIKIGTKYITDAATNTVKNNKNTSTNKLTLSSTKAAGTEFTPSISDGVVTLESSRTVTLVAGEAHPKFQYNKNSGQERFTCYAQGTQSDLVFYKKN